MLIDGVTLVNILANSRNYSHSNDSKNRLMKSTELTSSAEFGELFWTRKLKEKTSF